MSPTSCQTAPPRTRRAQILQSPARIASRARRCPGQKAGERAVEPGRSALLADLDRNEGELRALAARLDGYQAVILLGAAHELDFVGRRLVLAHRLLRFVVELDVALALEHRAVRAQLVLVEIE